jgi:hypothetical protein
MAMSKNVVEISDNETADQANLALMMLLLALRVLMLLLALGVLLLLLALRAPTC